MMQIKKSFQSSFIILALYFLAIFLKIRLINFALEDYNGFLRYWVAYIHQHGLLHAYGTAFSNYAPLYTYLLGIFDLLSPFLSTLYIVKTVTFTGEALAVYYVYEIVALHQRQTHHLFSPGVAAVMLLLLPTVLANGALIAQCDIWYTACLLAAVYYLIDIKRYKALICFGFSFSFKPQAMFLAPLLLVYVLRRKIYWKDLWIIPAVYFLTCVPAWLEGRPLSDLLLMYWWQFVHGNMDITSWMAANMYTYSSGMNREWIIDGGVFITITAASALAYVSCRRWHSENSVLAAILLATLFAGLMPFLLPGMLCRYFFAADIFSFVLACLRPRWFFIAVMFQYASLVATLSIYDFPALASWSWPHHSWIGRLRTAMWINTAAIASLLWLCYQYLWKRNPLPLPDADDFSRAPSLHRHPLL